MPFPGPTPTDMFATASFAKRVFTRIVRTRHASITGGRLFLTIEVTEEIPEPWLTSLLCLYEDSRTAMKGAGMIERVRRVDHRTYQLISDNAAPASDDLIPLSKGMRVRLVTRGGDHIDLFPEPRR